MTGVVLAGGRASRLGGDKAGARVGGRSLGAIAVAALRAAGCARVAVVARADTSLPADLDAERWLEDAALDRHPRTGLVTALERVPEALVLAVDLPLVEPAFLARLAAGRALAAGQPLCGLYARADLAVLRAAPPGEPLRVTVARLGRPVLDAPPGTLLNVNAPADLDAVRARTSGVALAPCVPPS